MLRYILIIVALSFLLAPGSSSAPEPNLIDNGDFELGDLVGFNSDHLSNLDGGDLAKPGTYVIGTNPRDHDKSWASFGDHGSGKGRMMIVNGATSTQKSMTVWQNAVPITVVPGMSYEVRYWIALSSKEAPPVLELKANGVSMGIFDPRDGSDEAEVGVWKSVTQVWQADAMTVTFSLTDIKPVEKGNDYALDDMSCTQLITPPPTATAK